MAAGITFAGWPDAVAARSEVSTLARHAARTLHEFLGLPVAAIVLLVGVATLMPRTPIVDHIRARDEAAKTANAQLAELAAGMQALYYGAYDWRGSLLRDRSLYVRSMVETYTCGERIWSMGSVESPASGFSVMTALERPNAASPRFTEAYDRVHEQRRRLQASGVAFVAWRLSGRATSYLQIAGIHWYGVPRDGDLSETYHPPCAIEKFYEDVHPLLPWKTDAVDEPWIERDLARVARNAARYMDICIADIALAELALYAATNYLTGRMIGRWWLRAFSATQK